MSNWILLNRRMEEKLRAGTCLDVSQCARTESGDYILDAFEEDKDYCDALKEQWIWSIGRDKAGQIFASTMDKFYQNPDFECLFLR